MILIDSLLKRMIVPSSSIEAEIERLNARLDLRGHKKGDEVWDYLDTIDAKASAMLGHISIFSAVAGILLSTSTGEPSIRLALTIEFVSLLFLTFLCLRCLRILVPNADEVDGEVAYRNAVHEMLYRRHIYVFVHEVSGFITLAMIITAVLKFVA